MAVALSPGPFPAFYFEKIREPGDEASMASSISLRKFQVLASNLITTQKEYHVVCSTCIFLGEMYVRRFLIAMYFFFFLAT